ncbi:ribose-phosphate pyrophosphokinase [Ensifer adhaerens]|nr:ribose-phosphate pyrophosphokinase [Ensifer adhaerens]
MTMMAAMEPSMSRLFTRIDSMPRPRDEKLSRLMQTWSNAREGQVSPDAAVFRLSPWLVEPCDAVVFSRKDPAGRDYQLVDGAGSMSILLGNPRTGASLKEASDRRGAARCRRLFNWTLRSGEPVLVEFRHRQPGHEELACELLALPLRDGGVQAKAVLAGLSCRPVRAAEPRHSLPHMQEGPLFFAFKRDRPLAQSVVRQLGSTLSPLEEREFEDGEHKIRPLVNVQGRPVVIFASLNGDADHSVNDRLCRLLFFIGALKSNGARRVTAVTPYLCYLRKDRRTKPHDPVTARYVAQLFEAVGTDAIVVLEAHNPAALENAFRIPVIHLQAHASFAAHLVAEFDHPAFTVVSPDLGAGKRADSLIDALENLVGTTVGKAIMDKQRSEGVVTGDLFAGSVEGRTAIIFDDMISSGTTMLRAAEACHNRGAERIVLAATHALFAEDAHCRLAKDYIDAVMVTNSVCPIAGVPRLEVIDISRLLAEALAAVAVA